MKKKILVNFSLFALFAILVFIAGTEISKAYTCGTTVDGKSYCVGIAPSCGFNTASVFQATDTFPAEASCSQGKPPGTYNNLPEGNFTVSAWCNYAYWYQGSPYTLLVRDDGVCFVRDGHMFAEIEGPNSFPITSNPTYNLSGGFSSSGSQDVSIRYSISSMPLFPGVIDATERGQFSYTARVSAGCVGEPAGCTYRGCERCSAPLNCYYEGSRRLCYNYCERRYDEIGSCNLECNRTYVIDLDVSGGSMLLGFRSAEATKTVRVICDPGPDPDPDPISMVDIKGRLTPLSSWEEEEDDVLDLNTDLDDDDKIELIWTSAGVVADSCHASEDCNDWNCETQRAEIRNSPLFMPGGTNTLDPAKTPYVYELTCTGLDGEEVKDRVTVNVTSGTPPPQDGSCGSATSKTYDCATPPSNNLCAIPPGATPHVSGPNPDNKWRWTCSGLGGGDPASCEASCDPGTIPPTERESGGFKETR